MFIKVSCGIGKYWGGGANCCVSGGGIYWIVFGGNGLGLGLGFGFECV